MTLRTALEDWRQFGDRRYRGFRYLAICQGVVAVLAGFDVIIPFALAMGIPPALAVRVSAQARAAELTLTTTVWVPEKVLGTSDPRVLGVMLDRVTLR